MLYVELPLNFILKEKLRKPKDKSDVIPFYSILEFVQLLNEIVCVYVTKKILLEYNLRK
jgi:hypothetical protein